MSQLPTAPGPYDAQATASAGMLLAVDLDGTLVNTDTLFEALAENLGRRPVWTLLQLIQLPFAIARVKARIQSEGQIDIPTLPVNEQVLSYCRQSRQQGRPVWLVSAADQGVVTKVAEHFGVFDRAVGSDGATNNKGSAKGAFLQRVAPEGFEYVGDSRADLKVWVKAKAASLVGGGEARAHAVEKMGVTIAQRFDRPKRGVGAWVKALHLHRWIKNGLIFAPAIATMRIADASVALSLLIAFFLLGAMESGAYVFNDLLGLHRDRKHPPQYERLFASGRLKIWQGLVVGPTLILGALAGGLLLSPILALMLLAYLIGSMAYALRLGHVLQVDALALIASLALPLAMGAWILR